MKNFKSILGYVGLFIVAIIVTSIIRASMGKNTELLKSISILSLALFVGVYIVPKIKSFRDKIWFINSYFLITNCLILITLGFSLNLDSRIPVMLCISALILSFFELYRFTKSQSRKLF